jgi:nucleoside-diphosphate-sugar epimerase
MILELVGADIAIETDENRIRPEASEVFELLCDNRALREATGWEPQVGLRDGLTRVVDWVRERLSDTESHLYHV